MNTNPEQVRYEFGFASDSGRKRKSEPNQDTVAVVLPNANEPWHPPLLLVADGLGRYQGGALASQTVVSTFSQEFKRSMHPTDYPVLMKKCVQTAHQEIRALGAKDINHGLMGSTVAAAILMKDRLFILNVGDSRVYIFDERRILQVSQDHSWVALQLRAGVLTEAEARSNQNRNRLTMAITAKRTKIESYSAQFDLQPRDVILLCSDGLWGVVPETLIRATAMDLPPQVAADKLVKMANISEGPDNISVIIARQASFAAKSTTVNLEDTDP